LVESVVVEVVSVLVLSVAVKVDLKVDVEDLSP
jgi:hypothetical protein